MFQRIISGIMVPVIIISGFTGILLAQQEGKIITIHPAIGKTITPEIREQYDLFPEINGFEFAIFRQMPDSTYSLQIVYHEGGRRFQITRRLSREDFVRQFVIPIRQRMRMKTTYPTKTVVRLSTQTQGQHTCRLVGVRNDSLVYRSDTPELRTLALSDVTGLWLVRHSSWKKPLLITLGASASGAIIGFAQGDDPPGWFSMSAEEKATFLGVGFLATGLIATAFVNTIKSVDIEVPWEGKSIGERKEYLGQILSGTYHVTHQAAIHASGLMIYLPDNGVLPGWAGEFRVYLKPRVSIDFCYGQSGWSSPETKVEIRQDDQYAHDEWHVTQKSQFKFGGLQTTVRFKPYHSLQPIASWGIMLTQYKHKITETRFYTAFNYPQPGDTLQEKSTSHSDEPEGGWSLIGNLGFRYQFFPYLQAEVMVSTLISNRVYPMIRVGIQLISVK